MIITASSHLILDQCKMHSQNALNAEQRKRLNLRGLELANLCRRLDASCRLRLASPISDRRQPLPLSWYPS